jgi:N-methylhydantoinase A
VPLPDEPFGDGAAARLKERFQQTYQRFFGRAIDGLGDLEIEVVTWSVKAFDERPMGAQYPLAGGIRTVEPPATRAVFDPATASARTYAIVEREALSAGDLIAGPAVIVERETSTVVTSPFDAAIQGDGAILLIRKGSRA